MSDAWSTLRIVTKSLALIGLVVVLAPIQMLLLAFTRGPASMRLPIVFHRLVCAVLGLRIDVWGEPVRANPIVYLCNHMSHLDISVIGSVLRASFVAKDDIRGWPVFGALARLQQTVFLDRNPRRAGDAAAAITDAIDMGRALVLFPEGTTSDGSAVLPFKSSVFASFVEQPHIALQPMTLKLLTVDTRAVDGKTNAERDLRDRYAYHGDAQLLPHLLDFMRISGAHLRLTFHPVLQRDDIHSRKQLAAIAHASVAVALDSA